VKVIIYTNLYFPFHEEQKKRGKTLEKVKRRKGRIKEGKKRGSREGRKIRRKEEERR